MKKRKKHYYQKTGGVLSQVIRHKGWEQKLDMHSIFPVWEKVVGTEISECSKPLKIVKNVLWVEVENSTWMQQLQYSKPGMLADINGFLKLSQIADIKFVLPQDEEKEPRDTGPQITFEPPSQEELTKFEEQVSVIEDDAIRDSMVNLWYLSKAVKKKKSP